MSTEAPIAPRPAPSVTEREQTNNGGPVKTWQVVVGVVIGIALLALLVWFILWAANNHPAAVEAIRDIAIIALALQACLFGLILVIMLIMLVRLVNMLEFEIKPILEKTNETVGMVRGTTTFVGQNVVRPVTKATAYVAGVRKGLQVLFGDPRRNLDRLDE
jgi:membrane protein implicated in regulation of membrane protease activity